MAQSKTVTSTSSASVSDLTDQVAALKSDIAAITDILAEIGVDKKNQAEARLRNAASEVKARGEQHLLEAQLRAEDLSNQAVEAVRQQPAAAVGMAVGIGFLIGFLTARK